MTVEEYFKDWLLVMDRKKLNKVMSKLSVEYKRKPICPLQSNVFKAFELCPLRDLKVVMLFYDPYPQKNIATGIAIGNSANTLEKNLSPSLKIIKEAAVNFEIPHNSIIFDPTLESWAKQGVLLLNSALTVEQDKIGSHSLLWRPFIASLLKNLSLYETGLVYVLFGKQAQAFKMYINQHFNDIIGIEHPAYFARMNKRMPSKLFDIINKICRDKFNTPIIWYREYGQESE